MAITNTSNKLIVREGPRLSGMVDSNHLQAFAQSNPVMFDNMIDMAFTSQQIIVDPIRELTQGAGRVKYLEGESDSWEWKQGIRQVPARLIENLESSNTAPGIDKMYFKMKFDVDYFSPGEVITTDKENFVRISQQIAPYYESGGYVYTVQLVKDDPTAFYPTNLLRVGNEYVAMFPIYSEQASQAAELKWDNIITLKDSLGDMMRLKHKVTGYVEDMTLEFQQAEVDKDGNIVKVNDSKWIHRADLKFWKQLDRSKGHYLFYGVGDKNLDGEKGYKTRTNYGFKYQLENWSNVETYNTFSEKLVREYLMDIFIGRVSEGQRNVTMMTGEVGFMFFDQAFKDEANKFLITSDVVLRGNDPMNLEFGYQIKNYRMVNGGLLKLIKLPYLDVDITNTMRDTTTGYPKQSANFYIMDFSGDKKDNFWQVKRRDSLQYGYLIGTRAPWQLSGNSVLSNAEDAYTLIARERCSPWIKDITAAGVLKWKP
jgi:hypothetical protein